MDIECTCYPAFANKKASQRPGAGLFLPLAGVAGLLILIADGVRHRWAIQDLSLWPVQSRDKLRLGVEDSNLGIRIQSPLSYR